MSLAVELDHFLSSSSQVAFSLVALTLLYALLGAVDIYLLFKFAKKGPAEA